jgi:hypothetical protein
MDQGQQMVQCTLGGLEDRKVSENESVVPFRRFVTHFPSIVKAVIVVLYDLV